MKNAIIVKTKKGNIISPVENFSKQNCIEALSRVIRVDADKIEQSSASVGGGIYGVRELFPTAQELSTNPVHDVEFFCSFEVEYGTIEP